MFEIVVIFFIIALVANAKKGNKQGKGSNSTNYNTTWNTVERTSSPENERFRQAARENIAYARERAKNAGQRILNDVLLGELTEETMLGGKNVQVDEAMSAAEQIRAGREEMRNTTILQRARANANEDKEDITLETMETEHAHSERVAAAVHDHPEDMIPENMLGNIEDLMAKGYEGELCFERDFVGEGMDMINRFTLGGNYGA